MAALPLDRLEAAIGPIRAEQVVHLYLTRAALDGAALPATDPDDLARVCRWLAGDRRDAGARALLGLTTDDVLRFLSHELGPRRGRRLCVSTAYRRLLALRRFFVWAVAVGAAASNPVPPERTRR